MGTILANLASGLDAGVLAMLTFQFGFFAFLWKSNRDLNAKLDRQQEQHRADMEKLREGLDAKLDKQQEQHRADMEKLRAELREEFRAEIRALRAEFHQFRDEVRCELKELRGQIIKLWQHIKKS